MHGTEHNQRRISIVRHRRPLPTDSPPPIFAGPSPALVTTHTDRPIVPQMYGPAAPPRNFFRPAFSAEPRSG